ncbi:MULTISPECIES: hypothetical protein [unclassified Micromonospora]|uniref:hypothetical protein n=1 Tax=unclassified Micromonospora TaxID=2617518 RepID=UPI0022B6BD60|nr:MULTISPECIES: hypothetical protein [unclassified Micromonospora]MCZ7473002.1 hypothetical protein [Micromonospora sp. WMMC273]WBC03683.1 hypothetical protein O7546_01515 [Micromonospora sp. WMMA1976]
MTVQVDLSKGLAVLHERGLLPDSHLCAFAAGSLARGWGNATSDVDLYVIMPDQPSALGASSEAVDLDVAEMGVDALVVDGVQWDLKYWRTSQIRQIIDRFSWSRYEAGDTGGANVDMRQRDLIERLLHALPISGQEWYDRNVLEPLRESAMIPILVTHALQTSDTFIEDAVGQMAADDVHNAILAVRTAFEMSIEALLTAHGEPGRRPKWRPNRFRNADQSVLTFDEYWAIETMRDLDERSPKPWIISVIRLCQRIAMEVNINDAPR